MSLFYLGRRLACRSVEVCVQRYTIKGTEPIKSADNNAIKHKIGTVFLRVSAICVNFAL